MSTQTNVTFSHYPQNGGLGLPIFSELAGIEFKTHKSCQKIYETKLFSKNEQAVNNTTAWCIPQLTTLPVKEEGYTINKNCFWDILELRYGWQLQQLPTTCKCGARFTMDHALSCKKGGFISLHHNQIRDPTTNLLKIISHYVLIKIQMLLKKKIDSLF